MSQLTWVGDRALTPEGPTYGLQSEHLRGEPKHYTLYYYPDPRQGPIALGDARAKNATDWSLAGTKREVKALAEEHYRENVKGRPFS